MKNSIFKSYTKKILKSEAFISLIIVFVLALGIVGTSYALYMDVDTDTNYQLVEVGDLSIGFDNGENTITLENMTPMEDEIAITETGNIFSFYIYNTGTYTTNYEIKLVPDNTNGNTVAPEYINYQICKDNAENCTDIKTLGENSLIYTDALSPKKETDASNPSAYYFLRLWINNQYTETNGGTIKYNVEISAKNASGYLDNKNTLAGAILNNPNITINNTVPSFTGIADYKITGDATSGELGLFKAEDDYGTSYYFRGAQSNNYVNFAGFTWRIVRINGDGSIRLILDGSLEKVKREGLDNYAGELSIYKESGYLGNAYIGYMHGSAEINNYSDTHKNIEDSNLKDAVDLFYETYLENDENNYHYEKYLSDTLFCNDKTLANKNVGSSNTALGYGLNKTYYSATERNYYKESLNYVTVATPTLKCAENSEYNYSRFTSNLDVSEITSKGVSINNDLIHPIALITVDELVMAGLFSNVPNSVLYIFDAYKNGMSSTGFWTMTPYYTHSNGSQATFIISYSSSSLATSFHTNTASIRPVINLKKDILISGGNGTQSEPYTINYN